MLRDAGVFARLQMLENGKVWRECEAQARSAAATFRYYASVCETTGSKLTRARVSYFSMAVHEPYGVVVAIRSRTSAGSERALSHRRVASFEPHCAGSRRCASRDWKRPAVASASDQDATEDTMPTAIDKAVWLTDFQRALLVQDPGMGREAAAAAADLVWPSAFMLQPGVTAVHFLAGRGIPSPRPWKAR